MQWCSGPVVLETTRTNQVMIWGLQGQIWQYFVTSRLHPEMLKRPCNYEVTQLWGQAGWTTCIQLPLFTIFLTLKLYFILSNVFYSIEGSSKFLNRGPDHFPSSHWRARLYFKEKQWTIKTLQLSFEDSYPRLGEELERQREERESKSAIDIPHVHTVGPRWGNCQAGEAAGTKTPCRLEKYPQ